MKPIFGIGSLEEHLDAPIGLHVRMHDLRPVVQSQISIHHFVFDPPQARSSYQLSVPYTLERKCRVTSRSPNMSTCVVPTVIPYIPQPALFTVVQADFIRTRRSLNFERAAPTHHFSCRGRHNGKGEAWTVLPANCKYQPTLFRSSANTSTVATGV